MDKLLSNVKKQICLIELCYQQILENIILIVIFSRSRQLSLTSYIMVFSLLMVVEIFRMTSKQVLNTEGYSNKQHRGNVGEGQFHLNQSNIDYHRKNFLVEKLTYEQLYQLFL